MLHLFGIINSIYLIVIIFLRVPQASVGTGIPPSAERFLNRLIGLVTLIYFGIALQLNLSLRGS